MKNHLKGFSSLGAFIKQRLISGFSFFYIMCLHRVSHSWGARGEEGGTPSPSYNFFQKPPIRTDAPPMGHTHHLKMKPPHLKNKPPSLKCEAPFHEMIPRKSTINNNLKSS